MLNKLCFKPSTSNTTFPFELSPNVTLPPFIVMREMDLSLFPIIFLEHRLTVSHKSTQKWIYSNVSSTQVVLGLTKLVDKNECDLDVDALRSHKSFSLGLNT